MTVSFVLGVVCLALLVIIVVTSIHTTRQQRTIERQQDTIQKLLNREPVTYAEVNKEPVKEEKEHYSAWGSRMVNKDEIE